MEKGEIFKWYGNLYQVMEIETRVNTKGYYCVSVDPIRTNSFVLTDSSVAAAEEKFESKIETDLKVNHLLKEQLLNLKPGDKIVKVKYKKIYLDGYFYEREKVNESETEQVITLREIGETDKGYPRYIFDIDETGEEYYFSINSLYKSGQIKGTSSSSYTYTVTYFKSL